MAIEDDQRRNWPSRLRGAWQALSGQILSGPSGIDIISGRANRAAPHPQAMLIESLIGGLPGPAIVLDREGRVIAFNERAIALAPALRRGEPALISLRMPELVDAIRRASRRQEPQRVEFFERVPLDRWFEAFVTPVKLATGGDRHADILLMTFNDRPQPAAPGRGNARRLRRQCQPRAAHAAGGAARLHRDAARHRQGRSGGARGNSSLSCKGRRRAWRA